MQLPLSPEDIAFLQSELTASRAAYGKIMRGQVVEVVTQGDVVKYGRANADQLLAYIASLEAKLAGRPVAGAIGMSWSL